MTAYDWERPGATALVVPFPQAEPAIGAHRRAHTPSGREGMYAHNTLIVPFVHASRLTEADSRRLRAALAPFAPFAVTLAAFGRFEYIGCLYLAPEPPRPFVELTEALLDAYPTIEYPPEGLSIVPHVTVASRLGSDELSRIEREVAKRLPIEGKAQLVTLVERGEDGRWFDREAYPLRGDRDGTAKTD